MSLAIEPSASLLPPSFRTAELSERDLQDLRRPPPIDCEMLYEQCCDNVEFAQSLLDEFVRTSQSRLNEFDAAAVECNHAAIASKAHALKGVVGILAANELLRICSATESAAHDEDSAFIRELIPELRQETRRTVDFISMIRRSR